MKGGVRGMEVEPLGLPRLFLKPGVEECCRGEKERRGEQHQVPPDHHYILFQKKYMQLAHIQVSAHRNFPLEAWHHHNLPGQQSSRSISWPFASGGEEITLEADL